MFKDREKKQEKGFSLVEVLVASTIFLLIVLAVYNVFEMGQRSYKRGSQAADLQQRVRVVHDTVTRDLRLVGYDSLRDLDGDNSPDQTDEQLEGAWKHAITIRANFNFEEDGEDTGAGEEPDYENSALGIDYVTTSNEEIITYALGNASTSDSTDLKLDLSKPRNATVTAGVITGEESVQITNIALTNNNNPPYTLYKYIYTDPDSADGGAPRAIPIAENIRSLEFRYYDAAGIEIEPGTTYNSVSIPATGIGGADLIGTANARALRANIAKIEVIITGMSEDIDMDWVNDPAENPAADVLDPYAPKNRLFTVSSVIYPPNMGKMLKPQVDVEAPDPPDVVHLHPGLYNWMVVDWAYDDSAKALDQGVEKYMVELYSANSTDEAPLYTRIVPATNSAFERMAFDDSEIIDGSDYFVQVWSVDAFENVSKYPGYAESSETADNTTTPEAVAGVSASGVRDVSATATPEYTDDEVVYRDASGNILVDEGITVNWTTPTENTEATAIECDFSDFVDYLDVGGCNVYRTRAVGSSGLSIENEYTSAEYEVGEYPSEVTTDENTLWGTGGIEQSSNLVATLVSGGTFLDKTAVPCDLYAYALQAVDAEGDPSISESVLSDVFLGHYIIDGSLIPYRPENLILQSTAAASDEFFDLHFSWDSVQVAVAGTSDVRPVNDYVLLEYDSSGENLMDMIPVFDTPEDGVVEYTVYDRIPKPMYGEPQETRVYTVAAYNPCNFATLSEESDAVSGPSCAFMGSFSALAQLSTDANPCGGVVDVYALGRIPDPTGANPPPMPAFAWVDVFMPESSTILCGRAETESSYYTDVSTINGNLPGSDFEFSSIDFSSYLPSFEGTIMVMPYVEDEAGCVSQGNPVSCSITPACCISTQDSYAPNICIRFWDETTLVMNIQNNCSTDLMITSLDLDYDYSPQKGLLSIFWNGSEQVWATTNTGNNPASKNGDQSGGNFPLVDVNGNSPILGTVVTGNSTASLTFTFSSSFNDGGEDMGIRINYAREGSTTESTCDLGVTAGISTCTY